MKRLVLLYPGFLLFSIPSVAAQETEITPEAYTKTIRAATENLRGAPAWRESSKDEYYENGKLIRTFDTVNEKLRPDQWRFVAVTTSGELVRKSELIRSGANYYCRRDDGEWQNSAGDCPRSENRGKRIAGVVSQQIRVETVRENGKPVTLYRQSIVYKTAEAPEVLRYDEWKVWLAGDGKFLRLESVGGLKATGEIRDKSVKVYEYDPPNLRIEAPIK